MIAENGEMNGVPEKEGRELTGGNRYFSVQGHTPVIFRYGGLL